ncbi:MAG: FMN-binding protein [Victivallales bacterium]|nr:FMN-binding protein [Victivallales bacterium]
MKDIFKLVLSLGLVCAIGSFALSRVYTTTKAPIEAANTAALMASLKLVLPPETASTAPIKDTIFFKALDANGKQIAYAAQAKGKGGFGGDVTVLVGLEMDGKIRAVMVTENSETPGIGSKATDRKVQKSLWDVLAGKSADVAFPPNEYLDSYAGRDVKGGFAFGKDGLHAVSGATYSSTAILNGVNAVSEAFNKLQAN